MGDSKKDQLMSLTTLLQEPHTNIAGTTSKDVSDNASSGLHAQEKEPNSDEHQEDRATFEKHVRWKIDLRLCSIAGLLCSLNLLDSGILSSAAVTTMLKDLELDHGNRYSVSIFIFTIANVAFQLPATLAVRFVGPRLWFATITFLFGLLTMCTAFIHRWSQMIVLRVLLGISMSGIYPGLTYLISTWYLRREQQLRFAFLQSGEVSVFATGNIVNFGLNHLDGKAGLAGWRWMYLVQGLITCVLGIVTYWWMVDFPENAQRSYRFLSDREARLAASRIQDDRADLVPEPFSWGVLLVHFKDWKIYGFACMFFLLNLITTALAYFLPIILQSGMGFSSNASILLSTPVSLIQRPSPIPASHFAPSPQAILLRCDSRRPDFVHWRPLPHPWTTHRFQCPGAHSGIPHVRPSRIHTGSRTVYWDISRDWCICVELGRPQRLPS